MVGMGYVVVVSTLSFHIRFHIRLGIITDFFLFLFFTVQQATSGIGHRVNYQGSFFRVGNQCAEYEKRQLATGA